jgi:hypothetical protein
MRARMLRSEWERAMMDSGGLEEELEALYQEIGLSGYSLIQHDIQLRACETIVDGHTARHAHTSSLSVSVPASYPPKLRIDS